MLMLKLMLMLLGGGLKGGGRRGVDPSAEREWSLPHGGGHKIIARK